ncbi:hypothetical protein [Vibrio tapetis]|uniref:Uncharacterized protein n=1 Tax=Vibrio tapetis subsp. tapetis TaxID=1671868 RepID=A0A2N8ZLH3_9VIBR|nr:hypothetical protein [Vibrio tapetis]SON52737.1 conserved exported protein of unknown function [Vibrio tapetis subsp. tapetis]
MTKLYIAGSLLLLGVGILTLLSYSPTQNKVGEPIFAIVKDRILTQSLDGQRHYLLLSLDTKADTIIRIAIGKNNLCRIGDTATMQPITTLLSKEVTYQLIECS